MEVKKVGIFEQGHKSVLTNVATLDKTQETCGRSRKALFKDFEGGNKDWSDISGSNR
ncbi:hypothetical protein AAEH76_21010 [Shewanella algae]|uniref:hypothetical protein n=1 Tax=Shewanella algae TaxID=38313 RepID=UPI00313F367B